MTTSRQTRLYRVANLRTFQRVIRRLADYRGVRSAETDASGLLSRLTSCAIIVPTAAAAAQLCRTLQNQVLPLIVTRTEWYDEMHARLACPPRRLSDLEREVLMKAAAVEVAVSGIGAPFKLRAGLLVEMLGLYDDLRRRDVSIDSFERLLTNDLERDADIDRGADRLLKQTRFLAAAFRGYEVRRAASGGVDEHVLREQLILTQPRTPVRHVIVTTGERALDPSGLWPADLDLLARLPHLERVDIVATHAMIAAGLLDRLQKLMPGFEEGDLSELDEDNASSQPVLMVNGQPYSVSRDREDELSAIVARLKAAGSSDLDRCAIVFKRPLPYVYLAHDVFADAGIPYQTFDALPLAAEPYAAALDLIFEFVISDYTRQSVVSLLGCPHFTFTVDGVAIDRHDVAALNRAFSDAGYLGGVNRLHEFAAAAAGRAGRAARAAAAAAAELELLTDAQQPSVQLGTVLAFLEAHDRIPQASDSLSERHLRARCAIISAIQGLRQAHQELNDSPTAVADVAAMIRRWIEGQTFAPRMGSTGVHVLDAQAARYGEFDEIFLVGLIEGEWPERTARSIFYPQSLLRQLDWPESRAALAGERALFDDLVQLPRRALYLSTFQLENDSIVSPSVFLEDVDRLGLRESEDTAGLKAGTTGSADLQVGHHDLQVGHHDLQVGHHDRQVGQHFESAAWLQLRASRTASSEDKFHGAAAPHRPSSYTVSSLERYLECPFRFFAERVLELKEDPDDEATLTPKELGIFVHQVFEAFFSEWNKRGQLAITPENLPAARALFQEVVEPLLATLSDDEAGVQRTRLLGSAADQGLAEAVFQIEAEWQTPVVRRLLEHSLTGEFQITTDKESRRVGLKGKADRIDLLADGRFRIIDYKLGRSPDRALALQLPIYTVCAVQHLRETTGRDWAPGQAGYIAFGGDRRFVPMLGRSKTMDDALQEAQTRLLAAIHGIEHGEFPPTPADVMLCSRCPHAAVCRKDYVGEV